ncbi:MAG: ATP-binding cassette domain-containing protein [Tenericutes bacterium]|jgi:putative ABC transport system permease protein|nr:ATP-binding cassette domain-containing protein [Mycoplasmatota bacterium]
MLELKNIKKDYMVGSQVIPALKGIDIKFRSNEFVSILGPSGCGKTTLLNIIGGLDRYTSGDILIDQKSTKDFKDKDWDAYRNSVIGFVFQNYNLISHLSVLDNVEMALSLSGVNAKERKARASQVLIEVGLKDQLSKKPNQLSGGQQQRVAIARALVNNPKILLADEPTGAIDSVTSKKIMSLIQEISKDRLVIMVTHNENIAKKYSDRIIKLLDGEVIDDTNGVKEDDLPVIEKLDNKKTKMSFWLAIKTSLKNLFTKRARTLITAMAGSIGIIGVALVLGISNGMTDYVSDLETDTLAGYPISINQIVETNTFGPGGNEDTPFTQDNPEFMDDPIIYAFDEDATNIMHTNQLDEDFIQYLESMDDTLYNSISYTSAISLNVITQTSVGTYELINDSNSQMSFFGTDQIFNELPDNESFVLSQYDMLDGVYPTNANQVVLVVDESNQVDVSTLETLGFNLTSTYTYDDFIGQTFKVVLNDAFYQELNGQYIPNSDYEALYNDDNAIDIEITGIMRVNEEATSNIISTGIGYTHFLTELISDDAKTSDIVMAQINTPDTNVLTGTAFNDQITYDDVMKVIGGDQTPVSIQIYPESYDNKETIKTYIDNYNIGLNESNQIIYTDIAEVFSSTISGLISTITIILTAFAGISLVVSSIMIGIITYVSVIERTKEIGIMRSIGARKKDISRIFNAETLLIGLGSGILGVGIYFLLQTPVNMIINQLIDIPGFASLPAYYAVGLILLSSFLTIMAGLIPASIAAKKDPVIALRTE